MNGLSTVADREALLLAPYAMHSVDSKGRAFDEPPHPYRGCYQRDRDRITHSSAFRRLSHKTQVFTRDSGDYHRSRLTHTLEVASIARTLARALRLNEDLVEALALAHDIGHPPFGHAGEEVLDHLLSSFGGFNHNRQAVRIFEKLEIRYADFPGLNLSHEVLTGQQYRGSKHQEKKPVGPLLEVQVVDVADSIAYDAHDADDALEASLIQMDELQEVGIWHEATRTIENRHGTLDSASLRRAVVHQLIDWAVSETLGCASKQLEIMAPGSATEARELDCRITPPADFVLAQQELERFLFDHVYRHPDVVVHREAMGIALAECFARLVRVPEKLPIRFQEIAVSEGVPRAVGDYLSGLTDRALLELHRALDLG